MAADYEDADEWELINDEGFVHKRIKRPLLYLAVGNQPLCPTVEKRHRRQRKKRLLVKLVDKYLKEISRWELLSNRLKEMEQDALTQLLKRQELDNATTSFDEATSSEQHCASDSTPRRVVDDILSRTESQEAIIKGISYLCDVADALCNSSKDRLKQQLSDLPIWEPSPRQLMAGLCEEYSSEHHW